MSDRDYLVAGGPQQRPTIRTLTAPARRRSPQPSNCRSPRRPRQLRRRHHRQDRPRKQTHLARAVMVDSPPTPAQPVPLTIGESVLDRADLRARPLIAWQPLISLGRDEPDRTFSLDAKHADGLDLLVDERVHVHPEEHTHGVRQHPVAFGVRVYENAERAVAHPIWMGKSRNWRETHGRGHRASRCPSSCPSRGRNRMGRTRLPARAQRSDQPLRVSLRSTTHAQRHS